MVPETEGRWERNALRGVQLWFFSFSRMFLIYHVASTEDTVANKSNIVPVPKEFMF